MRIRTFARFRLVVFVTFLIVFIALERWIEVAIVGAGLGFVLLFRTSFRIRPDRREDGLDVPGDRLHQPVSTSSSPDLDTNQSAADTSESGDWPEFDMSPATVSALVDRGGNLYIWADRAGLLRTRATAPREMIVYERFFSHGCSIHIDREIKPGWRWVIAWKRLPWPHFVVVANPSSPSGIEGILDSLW